MSTSSIDQRGLSEAHKEFLRLTDRIEHGKHANHICLPGIIEAEYLFLRVEVVKVKLREEGWYGKPVHSSLQSEVKGQPRPI